MKQTNKTPKLDLTATERTILRKNKLRISELAEMEPDQLASLLSIPLQRAKELRAMAEFQRIPSIGPQFAKDLLMLGYDRLEDLKQKDGATLLNQYEQLRGIRIDPCVEDQLRLVVHYAKNPASTKQWWDFTEERKQYRAAHGYPASRPTT